MIVNFRIHGINQDTRKLTRTPTLIKKKKKTYTYTYIMNSPPQILVQC
jgi:hypothetical protein